MKKTLIAGIVLSGTLLMAAPTLAKDWCVAVWLPAASGNFALINDSFDSSGFRILGPYGSADSASNARANYSSYVAMGPTLCSKAQRFRAFLGASSDDGYFSTDEFAAWNRWYNCQYWKEC